MTVLSLVSLGKLNSASRKADAVLYDKTPDNAFAHADTGLGQAWSEKQGQSRYMDGDSRTEVWRGQPPTGSP